MKEFITKLGGLRRRRPLVGLLAGLTAVAAVGATTAIAAIDSTGGAAVEVAPPADVREGATQSDTRIIAFEEKQCVTLTSPLQVDITPGGGPGVIAAGTKVSSDFLHFDPVSPDQGLSGSITTADSILGVITTSANLNASDSLGAPGTTYQGGANQNARGLEADDSASIQGNLLTVDATVTERFHYDQIRVISECPPPPPPARAVCEETVNPNGRTVPPAGSSTQPGPKGGVNDDGFYRVGSSSGEDVQLSDTDGNVFGSFPSGTKVKYTEANGAEPSVKKIGSDNGQAGAVDFHITGTGDLVVTVGGDSTICPVPPPPK